VTQIKERATSPAARISKAARETTAQIKDGVASAADRAAHATRESDLRAGVES
jgi:hypothetical protein